MKKFTSLVALTTAFIFAFHNPSQANDHKNTAQVGGLIISNIWARITPKTAKSGAAFFVITNTSETDDTLVGVSSEMAKKTEIHQSTIENNVMKMRHVGKVDLTAGSMTELKPGSFHIMFMGLYAPIKKGDIFPLTLNFKRAGTVEVAVKASKVAKKGPMDHTKNKN